MKVCIIGNHALSLLKFRGPLIRAIVERGHEVLALAPDYNPAVRFQIEALGAKAIDISLSRTDLNPIRDLIDFIKLFFILHEIKPYVTLAYTIKPVVYGTLAASFARIPKRFVLITGLGYLFMTSGEKESLKWKAIRLISQALYKLALSNATRVFFQNADDLKDFLDCKLVHNNKAILVGPTGVDLTYFYPEAYIKNPVTFILAARLLREKGIREFVNAAKKIKKRYPATRFILVGGFDSNPGAIREEELRAWLREGIIEWTGNVSDVRPWLAHASIFVLPSYREGVPRSIQEAMAMARPIIATDVPGCRETVIPGVNGFLVPVHDIDALVLAMEQFIKDPDLIEKMGYESRRLAEERFDVHKINQIFIREMGL